MISIEVSRTGLPVVKKDGRFLASTVDPQREASLWAEKACAGLDPSETIIVLGLASGYHIAELLVRRPKGTVVVIENDPEILENALKLCPTLLPDDIVLENDWMKLVQHERFRFAVCASYRVVQYAPSCRADENFYGAVTSLLLGRDKLSFLLLMKCRPELLAVLNPDAIGQVPEGEPINIKTLQKLFNTQSASSRERRIWRILEELVL